MTNFEVVGEFCMPKARRRKSLQDLLGTVSGKISCRRRQMLAEDIFSIHEDLPTECTQVRTASPFALPDPALEMPSPHEVVCVSLKSVAPKDLFFQTENEKRNGSSAEVHRVSTDSIPITPAQPLDMANNSIILTTERNSSQRQIPVENSSQSIVTVARDHLQVHEGSNSTTMKLLSRELKHTPPSPSPERLCPTLPVDFLRDVSPGVPLRVR